MTSSVFHYFSYRLVSILSIWKLPSDDKANVCRRSEGLQIRQYIDDASVSKRKENRSQSTRFEKKRET
ncbi:hypothetical protein VNO77_42314 [Canavalia gladiata]|uniref:Uncharacterized protein n=1 Tax=Canavalia gladiata TaxID=3824 RepID=A0AAN9PSA7_CANGL